jgi:predicted flap endonuclease-1-like 5' DNA nuclease
MSYKIEEIEGIGETYGRKLRERGITTTGELLEHGATKKGRHHIAELTGIPESLILTWVNHADLFRINGVAAQFAELLEAAGVDTVKEFAQRNAENLHVKLLETNDRLGIAGKVPSAEMLQHMIDQAKLLEPKLTY